MADTMRGDIPAPEEWLRYAVERIKADGRGNLLYLPDDWEGYVIAVYRRSDDIEDKWIVLADGKDYPDEVILEKIAFQEQFFHGKLLR